jgi:hypothetical protein
MIETDNTPPKVLLVGYNGANNTGSEARLLSIIEDVRSVLGPHTEITVPTLNEENLRRYLKEDEHLHIAPIPSFSSSPWIGWFVNMTWCFWWREVVIWIPGLLHFYGHFYGPLTVLIGKKSHV